MFEENDRAVRGREIDNNLGEDVPKLQRRKVFRPQVRYMVAWTVRQPLKSGYQSVVAKNKCPT